MTQATATRPYLLMPLNARSMVALAMNTIEQVITLRVSRLTPMPRMPLHVLGLFSRNSRAWWLVNLPELLGQEALARPTQAYTVVAVRSEGQALGLAVPEVKGRRRSAPRRSRNASHGPGRRGEEQPGAGLRARRRNRRTAQPFPERAQEASARP